MAKSRGERRPTGELETIILAALWAADAPQTAAQVKGILPIALARTTVATVLSRLSDKGAVVRVRLGRGYAYSPAQDAQGLTASRMHHQLDRDSDRRAVLARFVSQLSAEDERIFKDLLRIDDH